MSKPNTLEPQPFDTPTATNKEVIELIVENRDINARAVALAEKIAKFPHLPNTAMASAAWNAAHGHTQASEDQLKLELGERMLASTIEDESDHDDS